MKNKILVISHNSFSDVLNNGKTMESLFRNFEKSEIAQLFFSENECPDFNFCDNYFKISDLDILKSTLRGSKTCGKELLKSEDNIVISERTDSVILKSFNLVKKNASNISVIRDLFWGLNKWKSPTLFSWIEKFNPNAIFYVGGSSGFSHEIATFLSDKYKIPLAIYFTDDYVIYPLIKNILDNFKRERMKIFYRKTVEKSKLAFTIGDLMAEEYSNYFKKVFLPIMNTVPIQRYVPYNDSKKEIVYSYFGGLHLNRWQMLIKFSESILTGQLHIYSINKPEESVLKKFEQAGIIFKGSVSGNELQEAILLSTFLLHVESDDMYYRSLTKLSVSTKIPEYLMSGRPIIGYGPTDVASMQILSSNKIGIVISSSLSKEKLSQQLNDAINDFEFRRELGFKGHKFAVEHFDNKNTAIEFKTKLLQMIANN